MNKHRHLRSLLVALPALALLTTVLLPVVLAQTQEEPQVQTPVTPVATPTTEKQTPDTGTGDKQQPTEPGSTQGKQLKPFKPTEKIQADSAVAFPIDI